jgi:murein DD-endopeptidase MepM/ murein hydrolase activator NlpD
MAFPLTFIPKESWHERPRHFGAPRSNGARKHAGCDLYAPPGTPVRAVADGKIVTFRPFYLGSFAIVVDHGTFIVRYGEVKSKMAPGLKVGDKVKQGQTLGEVSILKGLKVSMIHFEMFKGNAKGELTQNKKPFFRRADLLDPTPFLDDWAKQPLPK